MATMEVHPADVVSVTFLKTYFSTLTRMPHEAHKVYADASVVSRPGPDGTMMSFTSAEAINKHILSCGYTSFELLKIDYHTTLDYGIFIMVIGFLTQKKNNVIRKFSQMFYLARQDTYNYVILDDIFRYVDDEEASTPTNLPVFESKTEVAKQVDKINKFLKRIHKTDADDENWISINADDVKNVHANVIETASPSRLDGTELRSVIAAMVQGARKDMGQPKPMCKTEPVHKTDASAENIVNAPEVKNAEDNKNVAAQEPTEPVSPQPDGANLSLVARLRQFLSLVS